MYGRFSYIYHRNPPSAGKYTSPRWYGKHLPNHRRLRIPMVPGVDSLNVGVSVGIVLHQALGAAVQRRRDGTKDGRQKERLTVTLPET